MDYKEYLAESKKLFAEAKEIIANPESGAEDCEKATKMIQTAQDYKSKGVQLKEIAMTSAELDEKVQDVKKEIANGQRQEKVGPEFKTLGEMLVSIRNWSKFGSKDERLHWYDDKDGTLTGIKDILEMTGATGGFLVPTEFIARLQAALDEANFVRRRATIIPMRRRQVDIPVLDQTSTTADQPHWFGGMQFSWAEEAAQKDQSDPTFRLISLVAHKLIGYTRASDEILADSAISLEAFLSGPLGFVGGAEWMEEYAFLQGTGVGQPLGVINAGATITVPRAADGAIGYPDLCDMMENFLPSGRGMWVITQSALSDLIQLAGPAGNASYVWQPNARDGVPGFLLGFPVVWSEKVPRIGEPGDVLLADWSYYLIGDRQAITVESTQFDRWRYDETSWRLVHRVDGQPWLSQPLTFQDGLNMAPVYSDMYSKPRISVNTCDGNAETQPEREGRNDYQEATPVVDGIVWSATNRKLQSLAEMTKPPERAVTKMQLKFPPSSFWVEKKAKAA